MFTFSTTIHHMILRGNLGDSRPVLLFPFDAAYDPGGQVHQCDIVAGWRIDQAPGALMIKPQRRLPTFASAPQLQVLESAFLSKERLDEEDKYRLASETGLTSGWINDWFTRRRKKKRTNSPAKSNNDTGKNKRRRVVDPDAGFPRICADASLNYQEGTPPPSSLAPMGGLKMEFLRYMPVSSLPSSSRQSSISAGEADSRISECSTPANEPDVLISNGASVDSLPSSGLSPGSPSAGLNGDTPALTPDLGSSELHDSSRSLSQSPSLGYIPATFPSLPAHPGVQPDVPEAHLVEGAHGATLSLPVIQPDPTVFDTGDSLDLSDEFRASSVFTQLTQSTILTPPRPDSTFNTHHSSQQFYPSRLCDLSYGLGFSSGGLQTQSNSTSLNGSYGPQASRPVPLSFRVRLSDLNAYHQAILELNLLRNSCTLNANEAASMVSSEPLPPSLRYHISFSAWQHSDLDITATATKRAEAQNHTMQKRPHQSSQINVQRFAGEQPVASVAPLLPVTQLLMHR